MSGARPSASAMISSSFQLFSSAMARSPSGRNHGYVEVLQPIDEVGSEASRLPLHFEAKNMTRHLAKRHSKLHFRQPGADTDMLAGAKPDMLHRTTAHVEPIGVLENRLITVAREIPHHDLVAL